MPYVGILAYGSLIEDPGPEIAAAKARVETDVQTPFKVEFARTSTTRGGAPTLVPVRAGGGRVRAQIIVLKNTVSENEARDLIWRRETRRIGSGRRYVHPDNPGPNTTVVRNAGAMWGIDTVFYTEIGANITPLTATELARLAIRSVGEATPGMDGISYLIDALGRGLTTPLSGRYEAEIKRMVGAASLKEALQKLQAAQTPAER
jgi:hypothetical protein